MTTRSWEHEIALKIRSLLRAKPFWVQEAYCVVDGHRDEREGERCYCLLGATIQAMQPEMELGTEDRPPMSVENLAAEFIAAACPEFTGPQSIIDWNDRTGRTWEDVDAVIEAIVYRYAMEGRA